MKLFEKIQSNNGIEKENIIKLFNFTIFEKRQNRAAATKTLKLFGILIYKKYRADGITTKILLGGIFKKETDLYSVRMCLFGRCIGKKSNPPDIGINEIISAHSASFALIVSNQHQKVFPQFKNINKGKSVAIAGSGPSLNKYIPIPEVKHIALNKVLKFDKIKFDYFFATDYRSIRGLEKEIIEYDTLKFMGQITGCVTRANMYSRLSECSIIPEYLIEESGAYKFYAANETYYKPEIITSMYSDISSAPLTNFLTVAGSALRFAFWTHPDKIYLIGCDCSCGGHFDDTKQAASYADNISKMVYGYEIIKKFRDAFYPDVEIISINPVNLKGMFKDIYTNDNGEYTDESGNLVKADKEKVKV